jgi:hypothetical protein
LSAPKIEDQPDSERLIMIEEVERELYPAPAQLLLDLMRHERERCAASILVTTHSPALLAALKAEQHRAVIVCSRDPETGHSHLKRLTELPGYPELMAAGTLGDAVTTGKLTAALTERPYSSRRFAEFLYQILTNENIPQRESSARRASSSSAAAHMSAANRFSSSVNGPCSR